MYSASTSSLDIKEDISDALDVGAKYIPKLKYNPNIFSSHILIQKDGIYNRCLEPGR